MTSYRQVNAKSIESFSPLFLPLDNKYVNQVSTKVDIKKVIDIDKQLERATVSDVLSGNLINERSIVENVTSNRKIGIKKRFQTKHSEICTTRVINNPLELDNDISIC